MKHTLRTIVMALTGIIMHLSQATAQGQLHKTIIVEAKQKPLSVVLKDISRQGGFTFSYNTNILRGDSLVTVSFQSKTVKQALDALFGGGMEYKESDNYIILQRNGESSYWYVSGYVTDKESGQRITDASVYEPNQLVATLTNGDGYFRLRMKDRHPALAINISKMSYKDTSLIINPGMDNELQVSMSPQDYELDSIVITQKIKIEYTWYGKMFISSRDQMQSLNLNKFFVDKPYQVSLIPGFGTHGKMGSQVENKFSFNVLGGYTAAVNGFELGGLFNIVKRDMRYAQVAGLFNIVGGHAEGAQISGLYNQVLAGFKGAQIGGLANIVKDSFEGVQIAGLYNHVGGSMGYTQVAGLVNYVDETLEGTQIAGIQNVTRKEVKGAQIAGIGNIAPKGMKGIQAAGIYNYTSNLTGSQIGLINICDTSSGYSIGLLNLVRKGYHKIAFSTNEMMQLNGALKTGNSRLYSIVMAGMNIEENKEAYSFGFGFGKEIKLGNCFSLNPEVSSQHIYVGDWDHHNLLNKAQLNLHIKAGKYFSLFAGPSYSVFYTQQKSVHEGYRLYRPKEDFNAHKYSTNVWGWIGWNVGVHIF